MPAGVITSTISNLSKGDSARERTAPLQAAADVVPVVNPRTSILPSERRTHFPQLTLSRAQGSTERSIHSSGISNSLTGSLMGPFAGFPSQSFTESLVIAHLSRIIYMGEVAYSNIRATLLSQWRDLSNILIISFMQATAMALLPVPTVDMDGTSMDLSRSLLSGGVHKAHRRADYQPRPASPESIRSQRVRRAEGAFPMITIDPVSSS